MVKIHLINCAEILKAESERRMNAKVDEQTETNFFSPKFSVNLICFFFFLKIWYFLGSCSSMMNKTTALSAFLRSGFSVAKVLRNSSLLICKKISSATIYGTTCYCSCYVEQYRSRVYGIVQYVTACNARRCI